uniref:TNFR-Cys domain-containing protein n=1 Tax=Sinocyclocheilus anshuiensis TaxID=1608454 RepID=A0A671NUU5_9TELE
MACAISGAYCLSWQQCEGGVPRENYSLLMLCEGYLSHMQTFPLTDSHRDPVISKVLFCDQCPPGTAVKRHCSTEEPTVCAPCPEKRFAEQWHWGDSCQHCTSVCKERQIVQRECNSTHDRLCECIPGYHLVVEFCVLHTACSPGFGVIHTIDHTCQPSRFSRDSPVFYHSIPLSSRLNIFPYFSRILNLSIKKTECLFTLSANSPPYWQRPFTLAVYYYKRQSSASVA